RNGALQGAKTAIELQIDIVAGARGARTSVGLPLNVPGHIFETIKALLNSTQRLGLCATREPQCAHPHERQCPSAGKVDPVKRCTNRHGQNRKPTPAPMTTERILCENVWLPPP